MQVLLVDDDHQVLRVLERLVQRMRPGCSVTSVCDGKAALAAIDANAYDVVVTDIRMPGVSGVDVLRRAKTSRPGTVRVAMSGYAAPQELSEMVDLAHRFLAKPVDFTVLREAIDRTDALHTGVPEAAVRKAMFAFNNLPSAPALYARLQKVLGDQDRPIRQLVEVISRDDALSARLLQVANSAFYGASNRSSSVFDAVLRVGGNALKSLALSLGAFRSFSRTDRCAGFSIEAHEAHSFLVARIAARLVSSRQSDDAFAMALLHDIGKLVFASRMSAEFAPLLARAAAEGRPLAAIEDEAGVISHAKVGAHLLGGWGLPQPLVDAVAHHHDPSALTAEQWGPQHAVHVADALVHGVAAARGAIPESAVPMLDRSLLATLGVEDNLEDWRSIAVEEIDAREDAETE